jgi:hypothetical protein
MTEHSFSQPWTTILVGRQDAHSGGYSAGPIGAFVTAGDRSPNSCE